MGESLNPERTGRVAEGQEMEGWYEAIAMDARGEVIARYWVRKDRINHNILAELWNDVAAGNRRANTGQAASPRPALRLIG